MSQSKKLRLLIATSFATRVNPAGTWGTTSTLPRGQGWMLLSATPAGQTPYQISSRLHAVCKHYLYIFEFNASKSKELNEKGLFATLTCETEDSLRTDSEV